MPVDEQIFIAGTTATPASYTVPNAVELQLLCVNASVDGSAAASQFLATVEIVSDGGIVVARCPCFTPVSAGGTAEISWFRIRNFIQVDNTQTSYEALVLSNPHVRAYYKLDETSGTVAHDNGPLGLNGTFFDAVTLGTPPLADVLSATFPFAGLEYVGVLSVGGIVGTGAMAVACWIKTSTVAAVPMLLVNSDDNNFRYFQFRIEAAGNLGMVNFTAPALPAAVTITSPGVVNDGARHFVVGTLNAAGTQTLYIDGAQVAQNVGALATLSTRSLDMQLAGRLAGGPPVQNRYAGVLDEVAVYNFPLTAAEVAALYVAGTS